MLDAAFQCMKYFLSPLTCEISFSNDTKKKDPFFYYNGVIFRHDIISLKKKKVRLILLLVFGPVHLFEPSVPRVVEFVNLRKRRGALDSSAFKTAPDVSPFLVDSQSTSSPPLSLLKWRCGNQALLSSFIKSGRNFLFSCFLWPAKKKSADCCVAVLFIPLRVLFVRLFICWLLFELCTGGLRGARVGWDGTGWALAGWLKGYSV